VFYNRLKLGMMLQSDPTVSYALGVWRGRVFYRDLDVKSPYNTYRNKGLPPGPICNPGKDAVHAVLFPLADSTEYYFVARGDGTHIFSRTWEEHLKAIAHVRTQAKRESTLVPTGPGVSPAPGAAGLVPSIRVAPALTAKDSAAIGPPAPTAKRVGVKAPAKTSTSRKTPAKTPAKTPTKSTTTPKRSTG